MIHNPPNPCAGTAVRATLVPAQNVLREAMTNAPQTSFVDHYALSELPYFEVRDGSLVLADPDSVGPIIDMHTHLALAYGRPMPIDLWRRCPCELYLPLERKLDLDVYANLNYLESDLKGLKRDLTLGSLTSGGMRASHTAANLIHHMKELGIHASVLLPIDMPALSWNAEAYLGVASRSNVLLSYGSVHPHARHVEDKLDEQKKKGAKGIKFHPTAQVVKPDGARSMELYQLCAERDLPVLFHCGPVGIEPPLGRYLSQLKHYWMPIAKTPECTFILGHSGALQMEHALELAKTYPNVYLELASQSYSNIVRILAEAPQDRILFGTDWPFYHQSMGLAKVLLATEGQPELRKRVLYENAGQLLGLEFE